MSHCARHGITSLLISLLIISLTGCAQSNKRYTYPVKPQQQIVWPGKPAAPRIKYIGSFSSAEDIGIEKGFFTLLAEFFIGSEDQRLIRPMAVVAPTENEIYVADPGIKGVHYFNLADENYKQIRLTGDYPMPSPVALAVDHQQRVLVADSALGQVFTINLEAGIAEPMALQGRLQQPTGLALIKNANACTWWIRPAIRSSCLMRMANSLKPLAVAANQKVNSIFPLLSGKILKVCSG